MFYEDLHTDTPVLADKHQNLHPDTVFYYNQDNPIGGGILTLCREYSQHRVAPPTGH